MWTGLIDLYSVMEDIERPSTLDSLFDGELICRQHVSGYRFSVDPVLLAHFARLKKNEKIIDLGAGCGVVGLILLYRFADRISSLTALELQAGLSELCRKNFIINGYSETTRVIEGDVRAVACNFNAGEFSSVVCNPPFYNEGTGRKSVNEEALIARHQVCCNLQDITRAAHYLLKNRGKFFFIYPSELLAAAVFILLEQKFALKRIRPVYSYPGGTGGARLVLVEALKNGSDGMMIDLPLYIYNKKNGPYSEEMQVMFRKNQEI